MTPSVKELRALRRVNESRVAQGLPKYKWAPLWMWREARRWSQTMANEQLLHHPASAPELPNYWLSWGQNVGEGPSVNDIHHGFMLSPEHKANILDHGFCRVAIGIAVDANGIRWETQTFIQP